MAVAFGAASAQAKHVNKGPVMIGVKSGTSDVAIQTAASGVGLICESNPTSVGEIAPPGKVTLEYDGCGVPAFGGSPSCASPGAQLGVIKTNPLVVEPGFVKAPGEVGLDVKPATGEVVFEFTCPGAGINETVFSGKVKGSVIGRLSPINTATTTFTLELKEAAGKQEVEQFEGGLPDTLSAELSTKEGPVESGTARELATQTITTVPQTSGKRKFPDAIVMKTVSGTAEWGRCRKTKHAKFSDPNCQVPASERKGKLTGKFEYFPIPS
jgi:hypothetical protein